MGNDDERDTEGERGNGKRDREEVEKGKGQAGGKEYTFIPPLSLSRNQGYLLINLITINHHYEVSYKRRVFLWYTNMWFFINALNNI